MKLSRWASLLLVAVVGLCGQRAEALRTPLTDVRASITQPPQLTAATAAADVPADAWLVESIVPLGTTAAGQPLALISLLVPNTSLDELAPTSTRAGPYAAPKTHTRVFCIVQPPLGLVVGVDDAIFWGAVAAVYFIADKYAWAPGEDISPDQILDADSQELLSDVATIASLPVAGFAGGAAKAAGARSFFVMEAGALGFSATRNGILEAFDGDGFDVQKFATSTLIESQSIVALEGGMYAIAIGGQWFVGKIERGVTAALDKMILKTTLDGYCAVSRPTFYCSPNGTVLPATAYRYADSAAATTIERSMEARLSYVGFERFMSGSAARDAYQIFYQRGNPASWSDARVRCTFDTLQLFSAKGSPKVRVPYEMGDAGVKLEPFTSYYPKYGEGGYLQLIGRSRSQKVKVRKVDLLEK